MATGNERHAPRLTSRQFNRKLHLEIPHSEFRIPHSLDSDLLDELTAFPNGTHDDQIDAISLAVQMLAKREFKARGYLIT